VDEVNAMRTAIWILTALLATTAAASSAGAQLASRTGDNLPTNRQAPHRTRLYLKDGSYQIVMGWTITGRNVQYTSAERGGEKELIPLALVDLDATSKWEANHMPLDPNAPASARPAPALDPELVKEEAERALLAPEVAPDLHLAPEDAVLALDTYRTVPELVPITQTDGELNKQTGHSILRGIVKPQSAPHQIVVLKGEKASVQMHVADPAFYLKLDDAMPDGGTPLTVDTHGAAAQATQAAGKKPRQGSEYVIVRVDVRQDARVLASFNMDQLGTGRRQEDVFETTATPLPGGHWLKVVPQEQLLVGEYALVEVLDEKSLNLGVWDFGVHPAAPENRDVLRPEKRRAVTLERRERP
jgi:hypothetical protein